MFETGFFGEGHTRTFPRDFLVFFFEEIIQNLLQLEGGALRLIILCWLPNYRLNKNSVVFCLSEIAVAMRNIIKSLKLHKVSLIVIHNKLALNCS